MPGRTCTVSCATSWTGKLHKLGVEIIPYARLFGVDGDTVYFEHASSGEPIVVEDIDYAGAVPGP